MRVYQSQKDRSSFILYKAGRPKVRYTVFKLSASMKSRMKKTHVFPFISIYISEEVRVMIRNFEKISSFRSGILKSESFA